MTLFYYSTWLDMTRTNFLFGQTTTGTLKVCKRKNGCTLCIILMHHCTWIGKPFMSIYYIYTQFYTTNNQTFLPINPLFWMDRASLPCSSGPTTTVANWCCMLSQVHECLMTGAMISQGENEWSENSRQQNVLCVPLYIQNVGSACIFIIFLLSYHNCVGSNLKPFPAKFCLPKSN